MKGEAKVKEVIKMIVKTLNQMGVTLLNVDVDLETPVYFVEIDGKRTIQSLNDTLTSTYGILWTLTYGKVTDENRELKIDLQYKVVNEEEMLTS